MILANFDLSFFTSIPGLLITGGVLLLLIALIIFIATGNKKEKKNKKEEKTEEVVNATPTVNDNVAVTTMDATPTVAAAPVVSTPEPSPTVTNVDSVVNTTPEVQSNIGQQVVNSMPNTEEVKPKIEMQGVTPVSSSVEPNNNVVNAEMASSTAVQNQVPPVIETPSVTSNSTVAVPNEPVTPTIQVAESEPITIVNEEPTREETKSIYGGVSSVIPKIDVGDGHRPIYGGADPLENTGAIPTINNQETPAVTPTIPTIEKEPTVESVEPVTVTAPQVEVPTIETPSVEVPKQEVVTPTVTESTPQVEVPSTPKKEEIESLF